MNATSFDPTRRYVRVVERRPDGLVEFEFAVGEPELFVEMLLPEPAFLAFCREQGVVATEASAAPVGSAATASAHEGDGVSRADTAWTWTLHEAVRRELDAAAQARSATAPAPPAP